MSAPLFDSMISRLPMQPQYLNEHSYNQLNQIFDLITCIEPGEYDENRFIWLEIPRGPIEEFDDFESWKEEGEGETYEEFEKSWLEWYPDETKWYELMTKTFDGRRFFILEGKVLIEINQNSGFHLSNDPVPENYLNFIQRLATAVREQTDRLHKSQVSYNEYIATNLPLSKRYGRIQRKVLYEILGDDAVRPDLNLGPDRVERLKELVEKQIAGEWPLVLKEISANDFFRYCELGYDANDYFKEKKTHRSPREKYEAMADGRHGGLLDIDADSFEAFAQWYHGGKVAGSHPWEICRGGNSTHISLYIHDQYPGWSLSLAGSSFNRVEETARMAIALYENGIPFSLYQADEILRMITGEDYIGIVPENVTPRYCHGSFPKEDRIIDFMNIGFDNKEQIEQAAYWYPLKPVVKADR